MGRLFKHGRTAVHLVFRAYMATGAVKHLCNTRMGQCTSYMKWCRVLPQLNIMFIRTRYVVCKLHFICGYNRFHISTDELKFDRNVAKHLNIQTITLYWVCQVSFVFSETRF